MNIKDLVTENQYNQLKKDYDILFKDKEISFLDFCTKTHELQLMKKH